MTKVTRSTFKSFVRKNSTNLYIKKMSDFDGMTDGVEYYKNPEFKPAKIKENSYAENDLGYHGIWLTDTYHDNRFRVYQDDKFKGIKVSNCCGDFIVAVQV